jgi:apolipoprotein N-acyltransferase
MARVVPPWYALVWVVLVPWLLALDATTTWTGAVASGASMALAFGVTVFAWFPRAMADYAGAPLWIVALAAALAAPAFQPQFLAFALARHGARRRGLGAAGVATVGAAAYVATEWLLPKLFGDTLGMALYASPLLRQAADVAGVGGLTLVVVLVNECVCASVRGVRRGAAAVGAPLLVAGFLVASLATYGAVRRGELATATTTPPLTVGIIQADVAHYDRLAAEVGTFDAVRRILDAHFALSDELLARQHPDVLVWPETVYPTTFGHPKSADGAAFDRAIGGFVVHAGLPLIFGSYDADGGREYNAAVFLEPGAGDTVTFDVYRKATLFPLTERVPPWLDGPQLRAWLPWVGSWVPGAGAPVTALHLAGGRVLRVAPLICYDAIDPRNAARAVRAGAELIVTLSNDSWLADGEGAHLHFVVSAFRSIETGRPQVRATTTGISAVVTPTGDVLTAAGVHEHAGLVAAVAPVAGPPPPAVRWGDRLGPLALAMAAAMLALGGRSDDASVARRDRASSRSPSDSPFPDAAMRR